MLQLVTILLLSHSLVHASKIKSKLKSKSPDHQASLPSNINVVIDVPSYGLIAEEKYFDLDAGNAIELDKLKEKARDEADTRKTQREAMVHEIEQQYGVQYKVAEEKAMIDTAQWESSYKDKVDDIMREYPATATKA